MTPPLDHVGFNVSDFAAARAFLVTALSPLGFTVASEGEGWAMLGRDGHACFWFGAFGPPPGPVHVAFGARSRDEVRAFHRAALAAGGRDNGPPGLRPQYHAHYYGAFVIGPDGHNLEAVCHTPGD